MLVQQRPTWTCKNPRCLEQINFGSYCSSCRKLAVGNKLPDTIICKRCNKESPVKNITNMLERKKLYCDDCVIIYRREYQLNKYHTEKKKDKSYMENQKQNSKNYYYSVTRMKNKERFLQGNV